MEVPLPNRRELAVFLAILGTHAFLTLSSGLLLLLNDWSRSWDSKGASAFEVFGDATFAVLSLPFAGPLLYLSEQVGIPFRTWIFILPVLVLVNSAIWASAVLLLYRRRAKQ